MADWIVMGPKCSLYYMVISVWGVVMMFFMAIFFHVRSPALFEDVKVDYDKWKETKFDTAYIQEVYDDQAINCGIAAVLYAVLFAISLYQYIGRQRQEVRYSQISDDN